MNAHIANLINAGVLIAVSAWAYLTASEPSLTALIPGVFGVALLGCAPGVKTENKVVAHIAVVLTLAVFLVLFMPLLGAIDRGDPAAIARIVAMMATCVLAKVFFIKSFRDARKAREAAAATADA
ncbi:MAG: hypothetical protein AAGG72_05990 [Pseudomonadota bacterium]